MTISVDYVTISDVEDLFEIAKFFSPKSRLINDFETPEINYIDNPDWCILVARNSDLELVGYAAGCIWASFLNQTTTESDIYPKIFGQKKISTLEELIVVEERKGIGTLLVHKFEEWSKLTGCEICELAGGPAPGFYEKLNYKKIGPVFHYYKEL